MTSNGSLLIMLTGAAGFIGRHLSKELAAYGHQVARVDIGDGDLTLPGMAQRLIALNKPQVVVHLAGLVGRLFGEDDPEKTIKTNALGTLFMAKACAAAGVRLCYVSTSEAYGDFGERMASEDDYGALPHNLYGLSKRWGEEAARLYGQKSLQIFRLSMPYGPGLPAGRGRAALINFLWAAKNRSPLTVHRGGKRCWCWVGDTVIGLRMAIEDGGPGVWLVGRDDNEISMLEVARMACNLAHASYKLIQEIEPPGNQTVVKRLASERLRSIGWRPKVELSEGMTMTYAAVSRYGEDGRPRSHEV